MRFTNHGRRGDAQLYFLILLNIQLVLCLTWLVSSLTVPNRSHAQLHLLIFARLTWNVFPPLLCTCQILIPFHGSAHILSTPWNIPVQKDFFLESKPFSSSFIFSIYSHVVPTYSEYYTYAVGHFIFLCFL